MVRPTKTERTVKKHIALPEDVVVRMELELYSDVEERVPMGAQQELITKLLRQHFRELDKARKKAAKIVASAPVMEGG